MGPVLLVLEHLEARFGRDHPPQQLVLPASVDERSKELMREFGARNNADVRSELYSLT